MAGVNPVLSRNGANSPEAGCRRVAPAAMLLASRLCCATSASGACSFRPLRRGGSGGDPGTIKCRAFNGSSCEPRGNPTRRLLLALLGLLTLMGHQGRRSCRCRSTCLIAAEQIDVAAVTDPKSVRIDEELRMASVRELENVPTRLLGPMAPKAYTYRPRT